MRGAVALLLVTILGSNLCAAEKQPWEWTPAERAQARGNAAIREVIDGSKNP